MKRQYPSGSNRGVFLVLIPIVTLATIALGVMQFTWISRAAEMERARHLSAIARDGVRAINIAFDELRLIAHLVRTAAADPDGNPEAVSGVLASWKGQAVFPEFVRGIWVLHPDGRKDYHPRTGSQSPEYPADLSALAPEDGPPLEFDSLGETSGSLGLRGFSLLPWKNDAGKQGYAVLVLDTGLFLSEILPYYLSSELSGYSFTVVESREQDSGKPDLPFEDARHPDGSRRFSLMLPVPGFFLGSQQDDEGNGPPERDGRDGRLSEKAPPSFPGLFWIGSRNVVRAQGLRAETFRVPENLSLGRVEIRFAEGTLNREIDRWIFSNTAVSAGVLFLLLLCLIAVSFLYRRTGTMRMKEQEFVALMSHELRLPVTVIKVIADNIARGIVKNPDRLVRYGEELGSEADRLSTMIEGILVYAGLQSGNRKAELSPVNIGELVHDVTEAMGELLSRKNVRLEVSVTAGGGEVMADARGLRTILENLLMNAAIHGIPPDPREQPRIRLSVTRLPFDGIRITVEDNGQGIPKREQRSVFLPFVRTQDSTRSQHPGSGLGLHIIRRVALLNGGNVGLESPVPDPAGNQKPGCRFTVTLKTGEGAIHA